MKKLLLTFSLLATVAVSAADTNIVFPAKVTAPNFNGGGGGLTNILVPAAQLSSMSGAATIPVSIHSAYAGYTNAYSNSGDLTANAAAGTITANVAGDYEVNFSFSGGTLNNSIFMYVLTNGNSTLNTNGAWCAAKRGSSFSFILPNVSSGTPIAITGDAGTTLSNPNFSVKRLR